jgi:hypothetical protein
MRRNCLASPSDQITREKSPRVDLSRPLDSQHVVQRDDEGGVKQAFKYWRQNVGVRTCASWPADGPTGSRGNHDRVGTECRRYLYIEQDRAIVYLDAFLPGDGQSLLDVVNLYAPGWRRLRLLFQVLTSLRGASRHLSHSAMWFQLAPAWSTKPSTTLPTHGRLIADAKTRRTNGRQSGVARGVFELSRPLTAEEVASSSLAGRTIRRSR